MPALARAGAPGLGVSRALGYLDPSALASARSVVVKPNFVSVYNRLCATPVKAVEAVMEWVARHYRGTVLVAEGPALGSLAEGLRNYGYLSLRDRFDVEFVDLNSDDYEEMYVFDRGLRRNVRVRVARTVLECDYLISVVRPKTHDTVVVTLTIKNVVMGAVQKGYKAAVHQGYKAINLSLAYLATKMMPGLAVVDGYEGMEGDGPVGGTPRALGVAVAGPNALEVDALTARLMGFDPRDVGYLYYLSLWGYGSLYPEAVGEAELAKAAVRFRPHRLYREQLAWRLSPEEYRRVMAEIGDEVLRRGAAERAGR